MSDDDLTSILAYLGLGLKPMSNRVAPSDDADVVATLGPVPAEPFRTMNELKR
jgi:hypothetical protein